MAVKKATKPVTKKSAIKAPPAHPTYKDMIKDAIVQLKERNGSSRQALKKYIQSNHNISAANFESLFNQALRKGVTSGDFLQPKGPSGPVKLQKKEPKKEVKKEVKKPVAKKPVAKKPASKVVKKEAKKPVVKKTAAKAEKKPVVKKAVAKKPVVKKAPAKKAAPKKAATAPKTKGAKVTKVVKKAAKKVAKKVAAK